MGRSSREGTGVPVARRRPVLLNWKGPERRAWPRPVGGNLMTGARAGDRLPEGAWQCVSEWLKTPRLLETAGGERFHAWFVVDAGDPRGAVWTKPLSGQRQVRLKHTPENLARVAKHWAITQAQEDNAYAELTLRGAYLLVILLESGAVDGR